MQLHLFGALGLRVKGAEGRVASVRDRRRRRHNCRGGQLAQAVGLFQDAVVVLGTAGVKGHALRFGDGARQVGRALVAVAVVVGWGVAVGGAGDGQGWGRRRGWIRGGGDLVGLLAQHDHLLAGDLALGSVLARAAGAGVVLPALGGAERVCV